MATAPPLFRHAARHVRSHPIHLPPADVDLFLRLAGEGTYHSSVRAALGRKGYLLGSRFLPHPRVRHTYHAFARPIAAWTAESIDPHGRRDLTAVLGRRRVGILDIADDGTGTLDVTSVHAVPSLLADKLGLSTRPSLSPAAPLPLPGQLDLECGPFTWVDDVCSQVSQVWPAVAADIAAARWHLWRVTRNWRYDDGDGAFEIDQLTVLDTPHGALRVEVDTDAAVVSLWPTTSEAIWRYLTDGPDVTRLEHTEGSTRHTLSGTYNSPLVDLRWSRVGGSTVRSRQTPPHRESGSEDPAVTDEPLPQDRTQRPDR